MANFFDYSNESSKHALYMQTYLVSKCEQCKGPTCLNYHEGQAPRRAPILSVTGQWNYRPVLCNRENCVFKDACRFAHTIEEIEYHPLKYKTRNCNERGLNHSFLESEQCPYAHGDLRIFKTSERNNMFSFDTFKIRQCLLNQEHNFYTCENYHHQNDKRRDPSNYYYIPVLCQIRDCKNDFCEFSHNQTEIDYHPEVFKTVKCTMNPCRYEFFCPFLHSREIKEIQASVEDREYKDLKDVMELLQNIVKAEGKKVEEMDGFKCGICNVVPGDLVFKCGHLICEVCSATDYCGVCQKTSDKVYIINT